MARPRTIEDAALLDVAREVFVRRGVDTPTSAIARAAGVSEATLFKRFGSKERLLAQAMQMPDPESLRAAILAPMAPGGERAHVESIALRLIGYFREMLPRMLALHAAGPQGLEAAIRPGCGGESPPRRILTAVTEQLAECRARGVLRAVEPELLARVLIASVHNFVFFEHIGIANAAVPDAEAYVCGLMDLLWFGAAAPGEAA
ncbi:MAG: hypothetical protein RIT45_2234 [Pseudomonadota bacterium]|jgi:AcrR family transcriptional regulator